MNRTAASDQATVLSSIFMYSRVLSCWKATCSHTLLFPSSHCSWMSQQLVRRELLKMTCTCQTSRRRPRTWPQSEELWVSPVRTCTTSGEDPSLQSPPRRQEVALRNRWSDMTSRRTSTWAPTCSETQTLPLSSRQSHLKAQREAKKSNVTVTMTYLGQGRRGSGSKSTQDELKVLQQVNGGENICVFKGLVTPGGRSREMWSWLTGMCTKGQLTAFTSAKAQPSRSITGKSVEMSNNTRENTFLLQTLIVSLCPNLPPTLNVFVISVIFKHKEKPL